MNRRLPLLALLLLVALAIAPAALADGRPAVAVARSHGDRRRPLPRRQVGPGSDGRQG